MRVLRVLAVATGLGALMPHSGGAQQGRQFKDAWFWGVKGGLTSFSSATTSGSAAPLVGAEWLITRTQGGLYLSYDQAFLTTQGTFLDRDQTSAQFQHVVELSGLRRVTAAAMVFPMATPARHPYFGLGLAISQIASATPSTTTPSATPGAAADSVQAKRTSFTPVLIGGVQARLPRFSVFAHGTLAPTQKEFFLYDRASGRAFGWSIEGGIRYNVGSSIERTR